VRPASVSNVHDPQHGHHQQREPNALCPDRVGRVSNQSNGSADDEGHEECQQELARPVQSIIRRIRGKHRERYDDRGSNPQPDLRHLRDPMDVLAEYMDSPSLPAPDSRPKADEEQGDEEAGNGQATRKPERQPQGVLETLRRKYVTTEQDEPEPLIECPKVIVRRHPRRAVREGEPDLLGEHSPSDDQYRLQQMQDNATDDQAKRQQQFRAPHRNDSQAHSHCPPDQDHDERPIDEIVRCHEDHARRGGQPHALAGLVVATQGHEWEEGAQREQAVHGMVHQANDRQRRDEDERQLTASCIWVEDNASDVDVADQPEQENGRGHRPYRPVILSEQPNQATDRQLRPGWLMVIQMRVIQR
jgi:hypothetical protein